MHRKITRTGPATLTVAIPAKWAKTNNLKPGDEINIKDINNKLVISVEEAQKTRSQTIEYDPLLFKDILTKAYSQSSEEIMIRYKKHIPASAKNIIKEFIGLKIVEENPNKLVLSKIVTTSNSKESVILRRIYLLIKNSFEENPPQFQDLKELLFVSHINNKNDVELEVLTSIYNELSTIQKPIFDESYGYIRNIFELTYKQKYSFDRETNKKLKQLFSKSEEIFRNHFKKENPIILAKIFSCVKLIESLNKIIISQKSIATLTEKTISPKKTFTVGVCLKNISNQFWKDYVLKSMQETSKRYPNIEFIYQIPFTYPEIKGQEEIISNFIKQKVDAIIISPNHPFKLDRSLKKASFNNIKLIIIDTEIDSKIQHNYIGWDNYEGGKLTAKYLLKKLNKKTGNILIIQGQTSGNFYQRVKGFKDLMKNFNITIVKGEFMESVAYKKAKKILEKEHVDAIFATSDNMALGALKAAQEENLSIPICGFDGTKEIRKLIKDKKILSSIDSNPKLLGKMAIEISNKILNNKPTSKKIIYDVTLVKS